MSTIFKGVNATKVAKSIPDLIEEGQYGGKLRTSYDSYVLTADFVAGDTVLMGGLIPEGARLVDCQITTGALGGSCTIDVGWNASADALEGASATGFFSALPVSSATVAQAHGSTYEGSFYGKVLAGAVQPVVAEHAVSSGATGLKIQCEIKYVID